MILKITEGKRKAPYRKAGKLLNHKILARATAAIDAESVSMDSTMLALGIDPLAAIYEADKQALKMAMHLDGYSVEQIQHAERVILSDQATELLPFFAAMFISGMACHAKAAKLNLKLPKEALT